MSNDDNIIRQQVPHQVAMAENSNVAVSKTGDSVGVSVRKVLAQDETETTVQDASVAVHRELVPDTPAAPDVHRERVPDGAGSASEHRVLVPDVTAQATSEDDLAVPPPLAAEVAKVSVPDALGQEQGAWDVPGGVITDKQGLDIPVSPDTELPTLDIAIGQASARPTLDLPPALDLPTPQLSNAAAVKELLSDLNVPADGVLEEQLGGPGAAWLEMDYPARVVKLKIENDAIRRKLDVLERSAGTPR